MTMFWAWHIAAGFIFVGIVYFLVYRFVKTAVAFVWGMQPPSFLFVNAPNRIICCIGVGRGWQGARPPGFRNLTFSIRLWQKMLLFSFEWVKWNFTTFGPRPWKNPLFSPLEKILLTPHVSAVQGFFIWSHVVWCESTATTITQVKGLIC